MIMDVGGLWPDIELSQNDSLDRIIEGLISAVVNHKILYFNKFRGAKLIFDSKFGTLT
jgi:hypothetical protein